MLYVYIGCLTFGAIYSILSLVLGDHGYDHGSVDHGGASHGDIPSPFNPLVIASAITTFGAVGLIGKLGFGLGDLICSAFALGFAGIIGAIIFFGIVKLMYGSQSDSTFSQNDLVGMEAEVITPIPEKGIGEVVCFINGVRYSLPAKNIYADTEARGEKVLIIEVKDNVAMVTRKISLDDVSSVEREELSDRTKEKRREQNL